MLCKHTQTVLTLKVFFLVITGLSANVIRRMKTPSAVGSIMFSSKSVASTPTASRRKGSTMTAKGTIVPKAWGSSINSSSHKYSSHDDSEQVAEDTETIRRALEDTPPQNTRRAEPKAWGSSIHSSSHKYSSHDDSEQVTEDTETIRRALEDSQ